MFFLIYLNLDPLITAEKEKSDVVEEGESKRKVRITSYNLTSSIYVPEIRRPKLSGANS